MVKCPQCGNEVKVHSHAMFFAWACLLVYLTAATALFAWFEIFQPKTQHLPVVTPPEVSVISDDRQIYANAELKFAFKYPADWLIEQDTLAFDDKGGAVSTISMGNETRFGHEGIVINVLDAQHLALDEWMTKKSSREWRQTYKLYRSIAGFEAVADNLTDRPHIYFVTKNYFFDVGARWVSIEILDKIFDSFIFLEKNGETLTTASDPAVLEQLKKIAAGEEWKRYTNKTYLFTFKYPAKFNFAKRERPGNLLEVNVFHESPAILTFIDLTIYNHNPQQTIEDRLRSFSSREFQPYGKVGGVDAMISNGGDGAFIDLVRGGYWYHWQFQGYDQSEIRTLLDSFVLLPESTPESTTSTRQ